MLTKILWKASNVIQICYVHYCFFFFVGGDCEIKDRQRSQEDSGQKGSF